MQFAYRRMYIPGTNLTPYMVARGRQPISPNEVDLIDEDEALLPGVSLDEHNKCGAADPYSKTGQYTKLGDGEYCGIGCLGEGTGRGGGG